MADKPLPTASTDVFGETPPMLPSSALQATSPAAPATTLQDVDISEQLAERRARTPDYEREARAHRLLAREMAAPHNMLQCPSRSPWLCEGSARDSLSCEI